MVKKNFDVEILLKPSMDIINTAKSNLISALSQVIERLNKKYNKRVKFNLELIAERAVDQFYESYEPNMYSRKEGLYKGAKIIADDNDWSLDTGSEYMTTDYAVGKDYVFVNSFEKGWHGGAINGPDHPEPGIPWWKAYGEWYMRAERGPAPEDLIADEDPSVYIKQQEKEYIQEFEKLIMPYFEEFIMALKSIYRRRDE